ncbi:plasma membrane calcium, partial [Spiromyces aspiralis]
MGGVTAVCSDKTGTLTQNRMTVVSGRIADHLLGSASEARQFFAGLPCNVQSLFAESCAINSTAFEDRDPETHRLEFKGSKTECALLTFLKAASPPEGSNTNGDHATDATTAKRADYYRIRKECKKVLTIPFSSKLKSMTTIVDRSIADEGHDAESMPEQGRSGYRAYTKGASEIILSNCSHYLDKSGEVKALDDAVRKDFALAIKESAKQALRTFALAYKDELTQAEYDEVADFSPDRSDSGKAAARPKRDNDNGDDNDTSIELPVKDMVWIGMVGIQDPLREGVVESVRACQRAGIVVRMITGDNIETGKAIAKQAGILTPGSIAIEGKDWRRMSEKEQMAILPRVSVMARSSPEDKLVIVKRLQRLDHIVAMTGDGANDAPALKTADIGFSMGITGTEVAKEASDIVLMDDNFNSIVQALKWGRSISESVRKFLQFQLSVNIAAVTLSFLSALYSERGESILTAVQLLWVNLIMDTLAALALATESPTSKLLERLPIPATADLITYEMWAMIVLQAAFQVVVNLGLVQYGQQMFHIDPNNSANANAKLRTIVFNTFVFLQIFNELNCRRIMPNQFNVLHHLSQDYGFLSIQLIVIALQYLIVTFGGVAFGTVPLSCS